ncbi:MAG: type II toxin-antitoxin system VapC family toxin, partial [Synechococcaceae bacterium WB9_2_112]|nr:type II toxin-antitoxin system VapC family toxin [Synechococcaceae bacterium WB9_2_112]
MNPNGGYLLDSHVLLWWWFEPTRLSQAVQELLADPATTVLVSAATVWELSLKHHQGKLPQLEQAIGDLPGLLQADGFQPLPIALAHGLRAGAYSQPHRDPFDR